MKLIRKGNEPPELISWKNSIRPRGSIPSWDQEFPEDPKSAVRSKTSTDQYHICCYCAATISNGAFHIEHFRPRESYSALTYRWSNLIASCESYQLNNFEGKIIETQRHCGHAKSNWFEEGVTVDPQSANVYEYFRYTLVGKVFPVKNLSDEMYRSAKKTIERLNLNAPSLIERRKSILELAGKDAVEMSRIDWCERYINPGSSMILQEFWPALYYNYNKHWHSVLI